MIKTHRGLTWIPDWSFLTRTRAFIKGKPSRGTWLLCVTSLLWGDRVWGDVAPVGQGGWLRMGEDKEWGWGWFGCGCG